MKPYLLQTLKELALLGALRERVEISSQELAKQLQTSQQTASRYLLELDEEHLIKREHGIKKQLIMITSQGARHLEAEFIDYQPIFSLKEEIVFVGTVISGLGEGTYYTSQQGYLDFAGHVDGFLNPPGFTQRMGDFGCLAQVWRIDKITIIARLKKYSGPTLSTSSRSLMRMITSDGCVPNNDRSIWPDSDILSPIITSS